MSWEVMLSSWTLIIWSLSANIRKMFGRSYLCLKLDFVAYAVTNGSMSNCVACASFILFLLRCGPVELCTTDKTISTFLHSQENLTVAGTVLWLSISNILGTCIEVDNSWLSTICTMSRIPNSEAKFVHWNVQVFCSVVLGATGALTCECREMKGFMNAV